MIPCRPTGTAAFCYGLTAADNLSYSCNQRGIVSVQCTQSTTMVDDNGIPIPIHPAGICNLTRLCRNNRCTIRCRNIQTAVGFCSTGNRAGTSDKAAADSGTPGNLSLIHIFGLFTIVVFQLHLFTGKVGYTPFNKPVYLIELVVTWLGNLVGTWITATMVRNSRDVYKRQLLSYASEDYF